MRNHVCTLRWIRRWWVIFSLCRLRWSRVSETYTFIFSFLHYLELFHRNFFICNWSEATFCQNASRILTFDKLAIILCNLTFLFYFWFSSFFFFASPWSFYFLFCFVFWSAHLLDFFIYPLDCILSFIFLPFLFMCPNSSGF